MPVLKRDGVKLAYDDVGQGDPPLLLLHCWGGDRSYMAPQLDAFQRSHRVVSMDLRGHGESDKPDPPYTIPGFASDAAWTCQQLGVSRPVVVGHSMGGSIALELAGDPSLQPRAIVILEALVVAPAALRDGFRPVVDGICSAAYPQVMRGFMDQLFGPHFDPVEKARRIERFVANPQPPMASALSNVLEYDSVAAATRCRVPILYVSSGIWYTDVERFRQLCPQLVTAQTVGAGHYFELEVPEQVNPMIDRFLRLYARG